MVNFPKTLMDKNIPAQIRNYWTRTRKLNKYQMGSSAALRIAGNAHITK
jgi:hypothetical protein